MLEQHIIIAVLRLPSWLPRLRRWRWVLSFLCMMRAHCTMALDKFHNDCGSSGRNLQILETSMSAVKVSLTW